MKENDIVTNPRDLVVVTASRRVLERALLALEGCRNDAPRLDVRLAIIRDISHLQNAVDEAQPSEDGHPCIQHAYECECLPHRRNRMPECGHCGIYLCDTCGGE